MIDKDGNIVPSINKGTKYMQIVKDNVSVIALFTPIIAIIASIAKECLLYVRTRGYYVYFGIESRLMLPITDDSFYKDIGAIAIALIYWMFSIFAVRMILIKGNWIWKIVTILIIPIICSYVSTIYILGYRDVRMFITSMVLLLIAQWLLIFSFGFCFVIENHANYISERKLKRNKKKTYKNNREKKSEKYKWKYSDYKILGILIMFIAMCCAIYNLYKLSYQEGERQKVFGVTEVRGEWYAVIDANYEKLILKKCEIDEEENILGIYKDTYMCVDNNILINYNTYDTVALIVQHNY